MEPHVAYSNKYYSVLILDDQIFDESDPFMPVLSYALYNKETKLVEAYGTYLSSAITVADGLCEALETLLKDTKKEGDVVVLFEADVELGTKQ